MIPTNIHSEHLAGIIPVAGQPLEFNMPWHDCLMPIHSDYHAIEHAVYNAAVAGCNTIWIVLHREVQPIIKKKVGEWVHDPSTTWIFPKPFWNKKEIPIYYVAINARDRKRRDSNAWSCLYGAKVASYTSLKLSKWLIPKRFLVVSPYGITPDNIFRDNRELFRGKQNICFTHDNKTFIDDTPLSFTFDEDVYENCKSHYREIYTGKDTGLKYKDVFNPVDLDKYLKLTPDWFYKINDWENYRNFLGSEHNSLCKRPGVLVSHKWRGFVKDS